MIAVIPARGGSKRIKNKNILDFEGAPMISYPLCAAKAAGIFSEIHVSTDSNEIADVVRGQGFNVDFMRPAHLADDYTPVLEVVRWALQEFQRRGREFAAFALIMPCSPLLRPEDLIGAKRAFEAAGRKYPVLSVCEYPAPVEWAFSSNEDGTISVDKPELLTIRSQDLKPKYFDTGTFCIQSAQAVLSSDAKVMSRFIPYFLPKERAVDIDSPKELEFARKLYRAQNG